MQAAPSKIAKADQAPDCVPAFIDEPPPSASLADWQTYAANLRKLEADGLPHVAPLIAFADDWIERLKAGSP